MILLTGASGTVGSALLKRLTAARKPVRCLVRDPRHLGPERVRVQIALGDLSNPASFRNALRGVETALRSFGRPRPLVHVPLPLVKAGLGLVERIIGAAAFATWEEAELMEVPMVSAAGTADAEALGVEPLAVDAVLGA